MKHKSGHQKNFLRGGKKDFHPDTVHRVQKIKKVNALFGITGPGLLQVTEKMPAAGRHGRAYNFIVCKGNKKIRLVVKRYNLKEFCGETQSSIAEREFKMFQNLRAKGYPVPPTIRVVEINGEKHLALTDLRKFGDLQTMNKNNVFVFFKKRGLERSQEIKSALDYVDVMTKRASEEDGIDITESWEYVIDTKKNTLMVFVLDLSHLRSALKL